MVFSRQVHDERPIAFISGSPQGPGDDGFIVDSFNGAGCREIDPAAACLTRPMLILTGAGDDAGGHIAENRRVGFDLLPDGDKCLFWIDEEAARHPTHNSSPKLVRITTDRAAPVFLPTLAHGSGNELQLTAGPGYAPLPEIGDGLDGVGGGVEVTYAFTAFWSLAAGAFVGPHFEDVVEPDDPENDPEIFSATTVTNIWLGPKFCLDIFTVVPYVSLSPEVLLTDGELQGDQSEVDFGLRWTLGFDYRPRRQWSAGFEVNYHSFLRQPLDYPVYITTMFRVSFHHGFSTL